MKHKTLLVLVLVVTALFTWTGSAAATNWVYVGHTNSGYSWYVDSDTPQRIDSTVVFWQLIVWDTPSNSGVKKGMIKEEATLSNPRQRKDLETYVYDSDGKEIARDLNSGEIKQVSPGSINDNCIDIALKYAK